MKNRCYETMTRTLVGQYKVRVWRKSLELNVGPDSEVRKILNSIKPYSFVSADLDSELRANVALIVASLEQVQGIEAIEVLDQADNGGLVYPDWDSVTREEFDNHSHHSFTQLR